MAYKIAVASSDGKNVDLHLGSSPFLKVYTAEGDRLTNVWGDKIYRLEFTAKASKAKGSYKFTVAPVN